ncbi:MAG TPA: hypothetical protein VG097_11095 [Gemmata sp.]|nr:hypothetical protein [Gemmata sp.]
MDQTPTDGFRDRPVWLLGVAALVIAQVGLGLALFSSHRSWAAVLDDLPILSGRHPLHLYHGTLGAFSFWDRGVATCYDPQFQAGYPKTPVFDGGSRPAELFLFLGGGTYRPAAYKLGLFAFLILIPVAFVAAARGAGLPASAAILSGGAGILLGWSATVRQMIVEGQLDLLGAGLAGVVFVPWLARYVQTLGVDAWLMLAGTATIGWYFQPLIWVGLAPVILVYYLVFAPRHGPAWHLGLAGITFVGVAPNAWWIWDWCKYWWLRQPTEWDYIPLPDWRTVLGSIADYPPLFESLPGGMVLVFCGFTGLVLLWRTGHKTASWLLLLAALFAVMMARVAGSWSAVPPAVPDRVMVLAAGFLVPPTVYAVWVLLRTIRATAIATGIALIGLLTIGWVDGTGQPLARAVGLATDPLLIGFSPEQQQIIALLNEHATPEARVLWDETSNQRPGWNWSALLPLYTKCSFLGGLDPESGVEHSYCAMCSRQLTGRALSDWSDTDLVAFCHWYNVGWVMARSPAAIERWGKLVWYSLTDQAIASLRNAKVPNDVLTKIIHLKDKGLSRKDFQKEIAKALSMEEMNQFQDLIVNQALARSKPIAQLTEDGQPVVFYVLDRPRLYILSGTATWESANTRRVVLTNVVPDAKGEVHLSLHILDGLRVSPSYIQVKSLSDKTCRDPVQHIRLLMPSPVPRLTLMWENP